MTKAACTITVVLFACASLGEQSALMPSVTQIAEQWRSQRQVSDSIVMSIDAVADSRDKGFGFVPGAAKQPRWRMRLTPDHLSISGDRTELVGSDGTPVAYKRNPQRARLEFRYYLLDQRLEGAYRVPVMAQHAETYLWDSANLAEGFGVLESAVFRSVCLMVVPEPLLGILDDAGDPIAVSVAGNRFYTFSGVVSSTKVTITTEVTSPYRIVGLVFQHAEGSEARVDIRYADQNAIYPDLMAAHIGDPRGGVYGFLTAKLSADKAAADESVSHSVPRQPRRLTNYEQLRRIGWRVLHSNFAILFAAALPPLLFSGSLTHRRGEARSIPLIRGLVAALLILSTCLCLRQTAFLAPTTSESLHRITTMYEKLKAAAPASEGNESRVLEGALALCAAELSHQRDCRIYWPGAREASSEHAEYLAQNELLALAKHDVPGLLVESSLTRLARARLIADRMGRVKRHLEGASPYTPPIKAKAWEPEE